MTRHRNEQELASGAYYEPLPSLPEYHVDAPEFGSGEGYELEAIPNLDVFFSRIYNYWQHNGLVTIITSRVLNLLALAFTIAFSGFLLLFVNWGALHSECIVKRTCDIIQACLYKNPLTGHRPLLVVIILCYLAIFSFYWLWTLVHFFLDLRGIYEVQHFLGNKLGTSERQLQMMTWSEMAHRLVLVQRSTRLCVVRDLDEHDIVSRIMRKENYLIGMLNKGVLALHVPCMGLKRRFMLTKTLEWNLYWCILDHMFDDHFHIRKDFLQDEERLRRRFRTMALANLVISPFLLLFLLIYFFMKNAEKFYHHPGSLGSRRWSGLAKWRLREFNELPHYITHRLNASHKAAAHYLTQFPNTLVTHVAKFVAFLTGSFTALLLLMTMLDETLLERPLLGRHVVWWIATLGIMLTISRSLISDEPVAFDPELAMSLVVQHTHYLPRHWRGRAHSREVQEQFQQLFQYKVVLFLEEVASIILTPFVLYFSLPRCSKAIIQFVDDFSTRVEGVGDICSLAAFDLTRHGNSKYGAPVHCAKDHRSKQGKLEKSFLSFVATYPTWHPNAVGRDMLSGLSQYNAAASSQFLHSFYPVPLPGHGLRVHRNPLHPRHQVVEGLSGLGDVLNPNEVEVVAINRHVVDKGDTDDSKLEHRGNMAGSFKCHGPGVGSLPVPVGHLPGSYLRHRPYPTSYAHMYCGRQLVGAPHGSTHRVHLAPSSTWGNAHGQTNTGHEGMTWGQSHPYPSAPSPIDHPSRLSVNCHPPHPLAGGDVESGHAVMFESDSSGATLPVNETEEWDRRVTVGQSMLQSFYEEHDDTVQHHRQHRFHSRMVMSGMMGGT